MNRRLILLLTPMLLLSSLSFGQHSIAHDWNEALLEAIREDFARPTVHARNLFHSSVVMYDAWAVYDDSADTYLLGKTVNGFECTFDGIPEPIDLEAEREEAISFAAYRLLVHRFANSPGKDTSIPRFSQIMMDNGYNAAFIETDYSTGNPAALGNYIAACMIEYGLNDGSNEVDDYANLYYEPINSPLVMEQSGNPDIEDPNRWQPLTLDVAIDQSGQVIDGDTIPFLSPEWGNVYPFSLDEATDRTTYNRDGNDYQVWLDPGLPPLLDPTDTAMSDLYKWGFSMVSTWSSHLDPSDGVMWDISPNSIGNTPEFPDNFEDFDNFYNYLDGGDASQGYTVNPVTGQPYEVQMVPRGDYARVVAEFWADGPDSETPPGHWFTLLNTINDHELLVKRFKGEGPIIDDLEWDIKSYLALGGAMHDCAITAWSCKGYYDYLRPVSAVRYMGDQGQSTDVNGMSYSFNGLPVVPGYIEVIDAADPLSGSVNQHVGKMKVRAWRGPDFIGNPNTNNAGVAWIRSEKWWPYQRPTFVTPPFSGFVSGHSTYSRAAADILTYLTGDNYFPGGLGEWDAPQNDFLVFENGPSVDMKLQWATYQDASNESSLSRIWGGIHPPADDIPGRKMGIEIAKKTFDLSERLFRIDNDQDGFFSYEDCDDNNPLVNPATDEICDGLDNNCNLDIDEGLTINTFYIDADQDGYGNTIFSLDTCLSLAPAGYAALDGDCNDLNRDIYPNAPELCDNLDNDCDGEFDEGLQIFSYYEDLDGDGYAGDSTQFIESCDSTGLDGFSLTLGDCDDYNPGINPSIVDIEGNGIDENCDGLDIFVATKELSFNSTTRIFPNPSNGPLNIESNYVGEVIINIVSISGEKLITRVAVLDGNSATTLYTELEKGLYFVELVNLANQKVAIKKLVIN